MSTKFNKVEEIKREKQDEFDTLKHQRQKK